MRCDAAEARQAGPCRGHGGGGQASALERPRSVSFGRSAHQLEGAAASAADSHWKFTGVSARQAHSRRRHPLLGIGWRVQRRLGLPALAALPYVSGPSPPLNSSRRMISPHSNLPHPGVAEGFFEPRSGRRDGSAARAPGGPIVERRRRIPADDHPGGRLRIVGAQAGETGGPFPRRPPARRNAQTRRGPWQPHNR